MRRDWLGLELGDLGVLLMLGQHLIDENLPVGWRTRDAKVEGFGHSNVVAIISELRFKLTAEYGHKFLGTESSLEDFFPSHPRHVPEVFGIPDWRLYCRLGLFHFSRN